MQRYGNVEGMCIVWVGHLMTPVDHNEASWCLEGLRGKELGVPSKNLKIYPQVSTIIGFLRGGVRGEGVTGEP